MQNPLQTTITHAEPVFDSFSAALGRALRSIGHAVDASGMIPRGKARATYAAAHVTGHALPLVVVSCVAGGPDLPAPDPRPNPDRGPRCGECRLGLGVHNYADPLCDHHQHAVNELARRRLAPDLEADGYGWGPNARDLLYRGLTPPETTETPC